MRQIIPEEINKMLNRQAPYLYFVKGKGMVLKPDTPKEIVEERELTLKWFDEHSVE